MHSHWMMGPVHDHRWFIQLLVLLAATFALFTVALIAGTRPVG